MVNRVHVEKDLLIKTVQTAERPRHDIPELPPVQKFKMLTKHVHFPNVSIKLRARNDSRS